MARSPATSAVTLPFIHPDDMPEVYAMTGRGTCMVPLIANGATIVMDKREQPVPGDTVTLTFTREAAQRWGVPGLVKRLAFGLPPAGFDGLIVVQQLNPPRFYTIPAGDVLAVHKCVGFAKSDGTGMAAWAPSQPPPRATAEMLEGCDMANLITLGAASAAPIFDPTEWLRDFVKIGGGYVLLPQGRFHLDVLRCQREELQRVMGQLTGQPERVEALIAMLEARQLPEDVEAFA